MNMPGDLDQLRINIGRRYRAAEADLLPEMMRLAACTDKEWQDIERYALDLINTARHPRHRDATASWIAELLREYPLNSKEGLALMGLAECSLRIPDRHTLQQLIRDKLSLGHWHRPRAGTSSWRVRASIRGLMLSQYLVRQPDNGAHLLLQHCAAPFIRQGVLMAMRWLGDQFVFGHHIEVALARARHGQSCSFDMLGEAARTAADAHRYLDAYRRAILAVGKTMTDGHAAAAQHSISIKLSALHPRYETSQAQHTVPELLVHLVELSSLAMQQQVELTIDAEECDRLELSLDLIEQLLQVPALRQWQGLNLAVQAYQKRALPVIQWLEALARQQQRRIGVRLVKGAYWDTEIKRCQERGLSDFPVFTRKAATDVSYLACARQLLASAHLRPAFATHNALTIATLLSWIGTRRDVEFQRLHGMGGRLYQRVTHDYPLRCRVYAPVGKHPDLLPYLIRRMLENSSNSGFVQQLGNPNISASQLIENPIHVLQRTGCGSHPAIAAPSLLFAPRRNSNGLDLFDQKTLQQLDERLRQFNQSQAALHAAVFPINVDAAVNALNTTDETSTSSGPAA